MHLYIHMNIYGYVYANVYIYTRGVYDKFPDYFRMSI